MFDVIEDPRSDAAGAMSSGRLVKAMCHASRSNEQRRAV